MVKVLGWAGFVLGMLLVLPSHAADMQQERLVQRVIAITDGCQRQALLAQVQAGVAAQGVQLALDQQPGGDVLAVFAWQHLLYVFAGLAEQWPLAHWSRQGTSLAGRLRSGDLDWAQAQPALRQWQQVAAGLPPVADDCSGGVPRQLRRLGNEVVAWIIPAARQHAASTGIE